MSIGRCKRSKRTNEQPENADPIGTLAIITHSLSNQTVSRKALLQPNAQTRHTCNNKRHTSTLACSCCTCHALCQCSLSSAAVASLPLPPGPTMLVSVLLKEKQFFISCGPATQPASWLAHVACLRYDSSLGQHIGPPAALRRADGENIPDWTQPLHKCVADGEQLVVLLRADQHSDDHTLLNTTRHSQHDETEHQQRGEMGDGREEEDSGEEDDTGTAEDGAAAAMQSDSSDDSEEDVK